VEPEVNVFYPTWRNQEDKNLHWRFFNLLSEALRADQNTLSDEESKGEFGDWQEIVTLRCKVRILKRYLAGRISNPRKMAGRISLMQVDDAIELARQQIASLMRQYLATIM
jgi:hypothetical protein